MGLLPQSFRRVRVAAVLGLVGLASCNMETTAPPFDPDAFFTATAGEQEFAANYQVQRLVGELRQDTLVLTALDIAADNSAQQLTVIIDGFDGPGSYAIGAEDGGGSWAYYAESPNINVQGGEEFYLTRMAEAGTVTVTSWNAGENRIVGTFTFTAVLEDSEPEEPIAITNGKFSGLVQRPR